MVGGSQVTQLLHQLLQLFFQAGYVRLVLPGDRHQRLVLLLPALEIAPGLGQQLLLPALVPQEFLLPPGVELALVPLLLAHRVQQLVQVAYLGRSGRGLWCLLGLAGRAQASAAKADCQQQRQATQPPDQVAHDSPPATGMGRFSNCGAVRFWATRRAWARSRL